MAGTSKPVVLVFGESENDRKALATLISSLCPHVNPKAIPQPQVLLKGTQTGTAVSNAQRIADVVRTFSVRSNVICVFAHEDADAIEPSHEPIAVRIERSFRDAGVPCQVHAVVPAWELETWWFLFPDQVATVRASWQKPFTTTALGKLRDSKETFAKALRPKGLSGNQRKRFPDYRESDSIQIATAINKSGLVRVVGGRCASYDRFVASVDRCCTAA